MSPGKRIILAVPLLICIVQVPIFLQMTLTPDTVLYDLQLQCLIEGGVLYRDFIEPNLPGVVWVHATVRYLTGSSAMALRIFDLTAVIGIAILLGRVASASLRETGEKAVVRSVLVSLVLLFYFGTSDWCHCQRDTWMLLPCLMSTYLRIRSCVRSVRAHGITPETHHISRPILLSGIVEGVLWGLGFWLKPFVAVPAIAVLLASGWFLPCRKTWAIQSLVVVLGGVLAGLAGVIWMVRSGCWPHFVETLTTWNSDYFMAGRSRWTLDRYLSHSQRFWPWILLHVPAVTISIIGLGAMLRKKTQQTPETAEIAATLLQACYLGWILQAFAFQQLFDYIHVPGILLAIGVCFQKFSARRQQSHDSECTLVGPQQRSDRLLVPAGIAFMAIALFTSPAARWSRQRHWMTCAAACVFGEIDPQVKDDLSRNPFPRWEELQPVIDRLRQSRVPDRTVLAYNGNLIHLYPVLGFHPPTRFAYVDVLARCFPRRRPEMLAELDAGSIQFVVSDLKEDGWEEPLADHELLPRQITQHSREMFFPYNQRPIFRSGSYVLFEVDKPCGSLSSEYCPLSNLPSFRMTDGTQRGTHLATLQR